MKICFSTLLLWTMAAIPSFIKQRLYTLNIIRLVLMVSFIGEAIHSHNYVFLLIALLFGFQIVTNTKCSTSC